jgi:hypothetical protein
MRQRFEEGHGLRSFLVRGNAIERHVDILRAALVLRNSIGHHTHRERVGPFEQSAIEVEGPSTVHKTPQLRRRRPTVLAFEIRRELESRSHFMSNTRIIRAVNVDDGRKRDRSAQPLKIGKTVRPVRSNTDQIERLVPQQIANIGVRIPEVWNLRKEPPLIFTSVKNVLGGKINHLFLA